MFKKISGLMIGAIITPFCVKSFNPNRIFRNKTVAIVGPAGSAYEGRQGSYIDNFDIVIRINKALSTWQPENEAFIGTKTDVLYHSFFENNQSGGGPLDFSLFDEKKVMYVVNPIHTLQGWRLHFNFYKKYKSSRTTYILSRKIYKKMSIPFRGLRPTMGYSAIANVLSAPCKEIYITGFTFFKTPYAAGYRDDLVDMDANKKHIAAQGIHSPEIEFAEFLKMLELNKGKKILFDNALQSIVDSHR